MQIILAAVLLAACLTMPGAPALAKPFRIGALVPSWGPTPSIVGMRDGLVGLGYKENEDFVLGIRFTSGDISALPAGARELIELGVDMIYCVGVNAAKAAQGVTRDIPIVFTLLDDPVGEGLVGSFSRPGGNVTGVTDSNAMLAPKRLEVFKQIIPRLSKVLFVYDANDPGSLMQAKAYRGAARRLGIQLMVRAVRTEAEAEAVFGGVGKDKLSGILAPVTPNLNIPGLVVESTAKWGIPSMFAIAFMLDLGGLASYGPEAQVSGRQAARLVDKIMRGVKPADIPVEVNNDIEFAVNLKVAKALGLKIDPQVLYQADRIVR